MKKYLLGLTATLLLVGLDQWTKQLASHFLMNSRGKTMIPGIFRLEYLQNRGAAFGIFQGQHVLLLFVSILLSAVLIYCYCKIPANRRFLPLHIVLILILSGALGNIIDRITRNYVVDFLYFYLIDFPIFNVADCYVVIGAILAVVLILFYYKDEDFETFRKQRKGAEDV